MRWGKVSFLEIVLWREFKVVKGRFVERKIGQFGKKYFMHRITLNNKINIKLRYKNWSEILLAIKTSQFTTFKIQENSYAIICSLKL